MVRRLSLCLQPEGIDVPHIPRALHEPCNIEMVVKNVGVRIEMMLDGGEPYYKVMADRLQCPKCQQTILMLARAHLAEQWEPSYDSYPTGIRGHFV